MLKTIRIPPSEVAFLWDRCPACAWRKCQGVQKPKEALPKMFNIVDASMKLRVAEMYEAQGIEIKNTCSFEKVLSSPIPFEEFGVQLQISGKVDKAVTMPDDTLRICELKFAEPDVAKYRAQVLCYARALEHPVQGEGREVSGGNLFFLQPCEDLVKVKTVDQHGRTVAGCREVVGTRTLFSFTGEIHHREVENDRAWLDQKMLEIARIAGAEDMPEPGEWCDYCNTLKAAAHLTRAKAGQK